jgi:hypothetical protein
MARQPFELDSLLCLGEDDQLAAWGSASAGPCFHSATLTTEGFFLGIDKTGEMYLIETWLASFRPGS